MLVALVIMLLMVFVHANHLDENAAIEHDEYTKDHKPHEAIETRNDVERVLAEHKRAKKLSTRRTHKLAIAVIMGLIRGALLGGQETVADGMIMFGALSGILQHAESHVAALVTKTAS